MGVASFNSRCKRSASQAPPVRMPTRPVESVTPERSLRASSWHSASASGRFIKIALQDDLSGESVDRLLALALAETGIAEHFFGGGRGKPLVGEFYRKPEARLEHSQRIGESRFGITHRDPDPACAEIESEDGVAGDLRRGHGRLAHACPASSDNLAKSMPSSFIAAGSRSSVGVSKMIPSLASTVSQAFCLISFSSCPAAQPA